MVSKGWLLVEICSRVGSLFRVAGVVVEVGGGLCSWTMGLVFGGSGLVWVVSRGGFLLWVAGVGVVVGGGLFSWDGGGCSACSVEPQLIPRSGYFHFVLFLNFFPEAGVEFLSSISPVLFLAGDLTKPLSRFMLCPIS